MTARRRESIYQLKLTLDGIAPAIWRRVLVADSVTLRRLHGVIQKSMGWNNAHLHMFEIDGRQLGRPDPTGTMYLEDDSRWRVREFLVRPGDTMAYEYDFGDSWRHTVLLEQVVEAADEPVKIARCMAGSRACPPEDCGGIPGYQQFLEALLDSFHPEHRAMRKWIGKAFDPQAFDVAEANRRLSRVR